MNMGDGFTTGPAEAAYVVNELVKPAWVIPSHSNEIGTVDGKVRPGSKTEAFVKAAAMPVHVPLSGHTMIVRGENHPGGSQFGLFSTIWVEPMARRGGVADRLLGQGEAWMRSHALPEAATWTSAANAKLIELYSKRGYRQSDSGPNDLTATMMVRLTRALQMQD